MNEIASALHNAIEIFVRGTVLLGWAIPAALIVWMLHAIRSKEVARVDSISASRCTLAADSRDEALLEPAISESKRA